VPIDTPEIRHEEWKRGYLGRVEKERLPSFAKGETWGQVTTRTRSNLEDGADMVQSADGIFCTWVMVLHCYIAVGVPCRREI
jgi:hypothetical protein